MFRQIEMSKNRQGIYYARALHCARGRKAIHCITPPRHTWLHGQKAASNSHPAAADTPAKTCQQSSCNCVQAALHAASRNGLALGTSCLGCNVSIPPTCNMHFIRAARSQTTHLACHRLPASIHHLPLSVSAPHHLAQHHHPSALHLQNHNSSNISHNDSVRQCLESILWQGYTDVLCNDNAHAKAGMYTSQARLNVAGMAWMSSEVGMAKC